MIDEARRPEVALGKGIRRLASICMLAKYILGVLAAGFLVAAAWGRLRAGGHPASRTWLIIGTIFAIVSLYLFAKSGSGRV